MFAGQVKIVSHLSCRTSAILKYFCPLKRVNEGFVLMLYVLDKKVMSCRDDFLSVLGSG